MERQDGKVSDHGVFFVAGIFVFGVLVFFASRSPVVLHRIELPLLRIQAKIYSYCPIGGDRGMELPRIENIFAIVDAEVARTGNYGRINTKALRKAMIAASASTRSATRIVSCTLVFALGSLVAIRTVRSRRRLYDHRENVRIAGGKGVEGFLRVAGRHLDPDMAARLSRAPTPERLAEAFGAVREKVNMPCSVVARLFERGTRERMALLEYGKARVTFAEEEMDCGSCRNKSGKEI